MASSRKKSRRSATILYKEPWILFDGDTRAISMNLQEQTEILTFSYFASTENGKGLKTLFYLKKRNTDANNRNRLKSESFITTFNPQFINKLMTLHLVEQNQDLEFES